MLFQCLNHAVRGKTRVNKKKTRSFNLVSYDQKKWTSTEIFFSGVHNGDKIEEWILQ